MQGEKGPMPPPYDHGEHGDLPRRVGRLEYSVNELHREHVETRTTLSALATQVKDVGVYLHDLGDKLDTHRTRRPELGGLAAVAAVVLTIGAMAMSPMNNRLHTAERAIEQTRADVNERAEVLGRYGADRDYIMQELENLRAVQRSMQGDRFTKQDGHRLEDKIDYHLGGDVVHRSEGD